MGQRLHHSALRWGAEVRNSAPRSKYGKPPLRALIIDAAAKATAARVVEYAKAHHFHPGVDPVPGDNPHFVAQFNAYRAVFTITHSDGKIWRHLSISVPGKYYPHLAAVLTIATLFGFPGWDQRTLTVPMGWVFDLNEMDRCVVVAQPFE